MVLALFLLSPVFAAGQTDLQGLRAERRATSRRIQADKSDGPALFGLLVIPVDFSDARLPDGWNSTALSSRLTPDSGETLRHYFQVASESNLELRITLAPLVSLAGTRRDYSDRDLGGDGIRTRALATQSLEAVRDLGYEFRRLDMEGPDRTAGTDDDDGQVDGVLILHSAPGQENDPESGLIQPLQFFLEDPVVSDGIAASFYAVASMQSGPGIWSHETAHLLGLEDRYDPLLPSGGSEVHSRGGLGRFSLMASGAWGTGDGWGAALPDAYSRVQMGWIGVQNLPAASALPVTLQAGHALRIWSRSKVGPEFFLLETRDPVAAAPFDAHVPGGDLVIYHLDESLPEGGWSDDGPGRYHLRVRLVEADNDQGLQHGVDDGRAEDLFPGPLGQTVFGPSTLPASDGYGGPSEVLIGEISRLTGGVSFRSWAADDASVDFEFGFTSGTTPELRIRARETGTPLADLSVTVEAVGSPTWGQFSGGAVIDVPLGKTDPGTWQPFAPVRWYPDAGVPAGSRTTFTFRFTGSGFDSGSEARTWTWSTAAATLDFASVWPGEWVVDHPDGEFGTTWHRWAGAPYLTLNQGPVLACTDEAFSTSADWPAVHYGNRAHTTLTSGELASDVGAVRLVHAIETEILAAGEAGDGGLIVWVDPSGNEVPAVPLDGYPGRIAPRAANARHGDPVFFEEPLDISGDNPLWRTDIIPVPLMGPGPWKLRFVFASNTLWRYRGWFIASVEPLTDVLTLSSFPVVWDGDLGWQWLLAPPTARAFEVREFDEDSREWSALWSGTVSPAPGTGWYRLDGGTLLDAMAPGSRTRQPVMVVGFNETGPVGSRPVTIYRDGGDGVATALSRPWPNPGSAPIRFQLDVPVALTAKVSIFDVKGRLIRRLDYPAGSHLGIWDGYDGGGRRAPAGVYFLRLDGSGPVTTRKVVLLH